MMLNLGYDSECFPGMNLKEYNVGKYKSQFGGNHHEVGEGRLFYSHRKLHVDHLGRKWLLKAYGRAGKTADGA
jgi:hypothetical protein